MFALKTHHTYIYIGYIVLENDYVDIDVIKDCVDVEWRILEEIKLAKSIIRKVCK